MNQDKIMVYVCLTTHSTKFEIICDVSFIVLEYSNHSF